MLKNMHVTTPIVQLPLIMQHHVLSTETQEIESNKDIRLHLKNLLNTSYDYLLNNHNISISELEHDSTLENRTIRNEILFDTIIC